MRSENFFRFYLEKQQNIIYIHFSEEHCLFLVSFEKNVHYLFNVIVKIFYNNKREKTTIMRQNSAVKNKYEVNS